jgi:hypothetical protein
VKLKLLKMLGLFNAKLISWQKVWWKVSKIDCFYSISCSCITLFIFIVEFFSYPVFGDTLNNRNGYLPLFKDPYQTLTWDNWYCNSENQIAPYTIAAVPQDTISKLQEGLDCAKARIFRTR